MNTLASREGYHEKNSVANVLVAFLGIRNRLAPSYPLPAYRVSESRDAGNRPYAVSSEEIQS